MAFWAVFRGHWAIILPTFGVQVKLIKLYGVGILMLQLENKVCYIKTQQARCKLSAVACFYASTLCVCFWIVDFKASRAGVSR